VSTSAFEKLDKQAIALDLEISGRRVELTGVAAYEKQSNLGPTLRIHVDDPAGEFDLILREDCWNGKIEEVHQAGCRYRISLTPSDLVPYPS